MAEYKGIDVSENNGALDWEKIAAAGVEFAIIRAAVGKTRADYKFLQNVKGAKAAGIPMGVYHYSYALSTADAKKEAALMVSLVKGLDLKFPIWLDMEDADGYKKARMTINRANITAICKTYVEAIRAAGLTVGIYASKSWLEDYIDTTQMGKCDYWLAQWASKPTWKGAYTLWQNSATGRLSGLSGDFDTDVSYGYTLRKKQVVTAMVQDSSAKDGVARYAGKKTTVYKSTKLEGKVTDLEKGEAVQYFGWHCTIDGVKYAYVKATAGQGYVLADDLRVKL